MVNLYNLNFGASSATTTNKYSNMMAMLYGCSSVEKIIFPKSSADPYVHYLSFADCEKLSEVEIPDWVTSIRSYAFRNCTSLESIVIPSSVKTVVANIFSGCTGLRSITFENPALDISELAIPDNEGLVITCASKAQQEAIIAKDLANVTAKFELPPANLMADGSGYQYSFSDGVLTVSRVITTASTVLASDIELDLLDEIKTVVIPDETGITEISANMFNGWGVETIVLPQTLTTVSSNAFANMPKLTTVVPYGSYSQDNTAGKGVINLLTVSSIASNAFSGSSKGLSMLVYLENSAAFVGEELDFFAENARGSFLVYPSTALQRI